ncbi:MAG: hypothetical protein CM15mP128_3460 [Methanobacteriota archaeon]|nr:MAG: hypothetical protein CM15mP128_3460 [Euryarchaeota archaeon]
MKNAQQGNRIKYCVGDGTSCRMRYQNPTKAIHDVGSSSPSWVLKTHCLVMLNNVTLNVAPELSKDLGADS